MKKNYIIPIFVPHLGCKNNCSFCNQKSISGQIKEVTKDDVKEIIEEYLKNFPYEKQDVEVAFFGGSFTGIEKEKQIELLEAVQPYIKSKKISSIRCSTRPDYISRDILKYLKKYHVKTIELGVQSTNDYILAKAKRGHTFQDVKKASKLIRRHRFNLGHQMMVGLPDSTFLDEMNTAKDLSKLKPKIMRIYPVLVIKGTELENQYLSGEYEPLEVNQAVSRCKELCYFFDKKRIKVIRVGLQSTDTISDPNKNESSEIVAGPYHEAFRQLVDTQIFYDKISEKIKGFEVKVKEVEISVNPQDINNVVGYKRENILKIKDMYDVDIKTKQDNKIKEGKIKIDIIKRYTDFLDEE
ncbi:MAG: radical SAM protein [Clostridia bacterium]|nr:radical SAM protein [Clostridia bacterium]